MRKIGLDDGNCSICHTKEETIDHLFETCDLKILYS